MTRTLSEVVNLEFLEAQNTTKIFDKAQALHRIEVVEQNPTYIKALVYDKADEAFTVTIEATEFNVSVAQCTCDGEDMTGEGGEVEEHAFSWCRHGIAVGLLVCPDYEAPVVPVIDKDAVFERFLDSAPREELTGLIEYLRENSNTDDLNFLRPATFAVGCPEEVGAIMYEWASQIAEELPDLVRSNRDVPLMHHLFRVTDMIVGVAVQILEDDRAEFLFPAAEALVDALCDAAPHEESTMNCTALLTKALDLHRRLCEVYEPGSAYVIEWLENSIEGIVRTLPKHDFSPYAEFVESEDLVAAIDRAEKGSPVQGYLGLLNNDGILYIEFLRTHGYWADLATFYAENGEVEAGQEIVQKAIDHDGVEINKYVLGPLVRIHFGENAYVSWLTRLTEEGDMAAAESLARHPGISYDDVVKVIKDSPFDDYEQPQLLFLAAFVRHQTEDALSLLKIGKPVATPEEMVEFAEQQLAEDQPEECLDLVGKLLSALLQDAQFDKVAECLARLRTMLLSSPETLYQFYGLLGSMVRLSTEVPELRRGLIEQGLIPKDFDCPA